MVKGIVFTWTQNAAAGWADSNNDGDTQLPGPQTTPGKWWPTR